MSILINMEMPKNCGDCKAFVCYRQWAGDVGDCFCGITKNDAEAKKKNADCPLVPVPQPHGRLIDADKLSAKLNMMFAKAFGEGNTAFHFAYRSLGKVVENAPTIIPAEEGE